MLAECVFVRTSCEVFIPPRLVHVTCGELEVIDNFWYKRSLLKYVRVENLRGQKILTKKNSFMLGL
jgi:hypothetical protein